MSAILVTKVLSHLSIEQTMCSILVIFKSMRASTKSMLSSVGVNGTENESQVMLDNKRASLVGANLNMMGGTSGNGSLFLFPTMLDFS